MKHRSSLRADFVTFKPSKRRTSHLLNVLLNLSFHINHIMPASEQSDVFKDLIFTIISCYLLDLFSHDNLNKQPPLSAPWKKWGKCKSIKYVEVES